MKKPLAEELKSQGMLVALCLAPCRQPEGSQAMPEATVQAHRAQGEAWVKLHLEMLMPESTVVAAVTNQV